MLALAAGCTSNCSNENLSDCDLFERKCRRDTVLMCVSEPDGTPGWRRVEECEHGCSGGECDELPDRPPTACEDRTAYCDGTFLITCLGKLPAEATDCSGDAAALTCIELPDGSARCAEPVDGSVCEAPDGAPGDDGAEDDAGSECNRAP